MDMKPWDSCESFTDQNLSKVYCVGIISLGCTDKRIIIGSDKAFFSSRDKFFFHSVYEYRY